jgi:hypothetical protein
MTLELEQMELRNLLHLCMLAALWNMTWDLEQLQLRKLLHSCMMAAQFVGNMTLELEKMNLL